MKHSLFSFLKWPGGRGGKSDPHLRDVALEPDELGKDPVTIANERAENALFPRGYFNDFQSDRIVEMLIKNGYNITEAVWGDGNDNPRFKNFNDSSLAVAFTKDLQSYRAIFGVAREGNRTTYRLRCEVLNAKGKCIAEKERAELDRLQIEYALMFSLTTAFHGAC